MPSQQNKITDRKYLVPFVLITLLFFLWGFARAILDVLNKHFQNALHISITHSSLIQVTTYLGYFLMAIPAGIFINRYGYRRGVVFGLILFGAGSLMFIPGAAMGSFYAFLLCLFIIGCGLVFLETAANPYVTELGAKETATSRLNLSQSFNGLGSLFATFCIGQFLFNNTDEGGNVAVPYTILGILVLVIALVFSRVHLPEIKHEETEEDQADGSNIGKLFKHHGMFVFGLLALLCYEIAEISINSYFINFVTGMHWMTDRTASLVLTVALAFFMVGRFLGSWVMRYIKATTALFICAIGSVVCIGLVLCDLGKASLIALIANYLFEAIMFPTIFAIALTGLGNLTKSASSLLMMTPIGGCGFLLMGLIADRTHVVLPFVVPFVSFLIVLAFAAREYYLARKQ
uniref:sugar MFS transporter n=1 Tax=Prevotella sp. TaxID=59823 RepID=UPI0025EF4AA3|nr:sugar MFS transporter [Prevotella sp.]